MPPAKNPRTKRLRGRDFYHGMIQRLDVEQILLKNGDYLLRKTNANDQVRLALSVYWDQQVRHFMIIEDGNDVYFEENGHKEQDIEALVRWYEKKRQPITKLSGVVLKKAITREAWVLNHESIELCEKIGAGQFGEVFKAKFKPGPGQKAMDVAVKTLREDETIENQKSFLAEARLMRQLRHDNVVRIYGVAVYENPLLIVMELCTAGSLLKHLRTKDTTADVKLRWATEAARGLQYIASNGLIHRDIAARNCLLDNTLTLKIADFGLTLKSNRLQLENLGKVPVKWLARETLEIGVYSMMTDVWSYGVLCWEIYSEGAEPYPGMSNQQARAQILLHNLRMDIPPRTPTMLTEIIKRCWAADPRERPSFKDIVAQLEKRR